MDRMMVDASRNDLPYIHEFRPLGASTTGFTAHLTGTTYVELTPSEVAALPGLGDPGPAPELRSTLGYARKKPVAQVDIYPYRRNAATGQVERLVDYTLELVEDRRAGAGRPKSGTYPDNSKMASGDWYRFSVPEDGVYRITYDFLTQLGVNMAGMASDRINIYGNHAGQLPFRNSPFVPTDLLTNAIEVVDGGDGQFGPNDHILFYASGPQRWDYNAITGRFVHTKNVYCDSASYFIGIDVEAPKRVATIEQTTDPATDQITAFTDHQVIDRDLVNHLKSGRTWYSETFDLTTTYNYNFNMPYLRQGDPLCVAIDVLSRTIGLSNTSQWTMNVGNDLFTFNDSGISGSYSGQFADSCARVFCTTYGGNTLPITVTMLKDDPITSKGWMNFLAVNARRDLRFIGDQLIFRDPTTVGEGRVGEFILDQATSVQRIWDITDPTTAGNVAFSDGGATRSFRLPTAELREFIAFKNTGYLTPTAVGRVPNQNLHATALPVDLMIICPPEFQGEASRLADRRASEGLSVMMVDPQRIYNEFSSGARDATAIKRFMRMLYDRAGSDETLIPRYLLLFGDGSYNNISIAASNQNYIPSFQSYNSWLPSACFTSDDYFGLLDDNEGEANADILDIGVGRLPVSDVAQARDVVTKLLTYDQPLLGQTPSAASCTSGSDGGASDWRNWVLFTSDDMSGDTYESV
ncbi:MAG: hypothetical protein JNM91_12495, partial [Flavobacteriales bacterium]|nr:hypothetical protein [Flavobacteriales bacterium]